MRSPMSNGYRHWWNWLCNTRIWGRRSRTSSIIISATNSNTPAQPADSSTNTGIRFVGVGFLATLKPTKANTTTRCPFFGLPARPYSSSAKHGNEPPAWISPFSPTWKRLICAGDCNSWAIAFGPAPPPAFFTLAVPPSPTKVRAKHF